MSRLPALADRTGVGPRWVAPGMLPDVKPVLEAADVYCLTSRWEGLPAALMEAMAAGLPVVATRVGGIPELVTDGVDGTLVPPGDPAAVAGALGDAVAHPERGLRAQETVRARFSEDAMIDAFESLWRRVIRPQR